jgi:hypothetical protein
MNHTTSQAQEMTANASGDSNFFAVAHADS